MPNTWVALLKISGKVENARKRLEALPLSGYKGVVVEQVVFGSGGYDAVVVFEAPTLEIATEYISTHLRDSDPLTIIDTVTGISLMAKET